MAPSLNKLHRLLDVLIPATCLACGSSLNHSRGYLVCSGCRISLASQRRDIPIMLSANQPGDSVALYQYQGMIKRLVSDYKFGSKFILSNFFAELIAQHIGERSDFDYIVAIPSTRKSIRKRGFSHIDLLCEKLSKRTSIPRLNGALNFKLSGNVLSQVGLSTEQRRRNRLNSIGVNELNIDAKKILLIDDVITTGETLRAGKNALHSAGAERVDIVVLTRTNKIHAKN